MPAKIILIHPPVVKPSEPPAGLARLSSSLTTHGIEHQVIDANLEGLLDLMFKTKNNGSSLFLNRWDVRAIKNLETNLNALQSMKIFAKRSSYTRVTLEINRVLALAGKPYGVSLSLADYLDSRRSPVRSSDLLQAAEAPGSNPYYPYFSRRIPQLLVDTPDYIGFSLNFLSQAICTMAMIGFIKNIHPRQKIILGGSLVTSWIQLSGKPNLFPGLVDEVVAGAGETKLLDLLGIKESLYATSTDYRLLEQNRYLSPGFVLPYSAALGCWWRKCAFCPEKTEDNPYKPLSKTMVTEELAALSLRHKPSLVHLLDSSLAPSLLQALSRHSLGVPWYGFARMTQHLANEDFCMALKKSGCVMLQLGIESGDQTVLDALNKGIDLSTVTQVLHSLKKAGIAVYGYFLFGTPPESQEGAEKTLDFVCRHSDAITFMNLAIFNLPSASEEAKSLTTGNFYEGDLSLYKSFQHPKDWHRLKVRHFLDKVFKKHPVVAPILRRTPELFTSNHAPFFCF